MDKIDKRQFLKGSCSILTGTMLSRLVPTADAQVAQYPDRPRTNWSGNYTFQAQHFFEPRTSAEVQHIVATSETLRAVGRAHSFNGIADSTTNQMTLKLLNSIELDATAHTVTVGSGVAYGQLAPYIDARGFAVHNLASLPHVSVVGACATATHGSGSKNGNLATAINAIEFVAADGTLHTLSRAKDGDTFHGAVVNLGALGIVTRVTLDVIPTFQIAQTVYENMDMSVLEHHLEEVFASGYSVSLFTNWQNHRIAQVWVKRLAEAGASARYPSDFFGAKAAAVKLHPLPGHPAEPCTEQLGIAGPWYERLPHFKMNFTPSSGAELQTEYFVAREHGYQALLAIEELRGRITPHLFVTELRTIAADELWTSMAYRRPSIAFHFTWKPEWPAVKEILPLIEAKLAPFSARPHWAKLFTMEPSRIQKHYPRMADYKALVAQYDPKGKFRNQFLDTNVYGV